MTQRQRPKRSGRKTDKADKADKPNKLANGEGAVDAAASAGDELDASAAEAGDESAVAGRAASVEASAAEKKPARVRAPRGAAKRSSIPPKPAVEVEAKEPDSALEPRSEDVERSSEDVDTVESGAVAAELEAVARRAAEAREREAEARANSVTVAPPAKARALAGARLPQVVGTVNGSSLRSEAPDDEIWTDDGTGAGIEGEVSRAIAEKEAESAGAAARLVRGSTGDRLHEAAAFGSAQSLLSTDYYFRQYGAHGMRSLVAEIDDMGFDPHVDAKVRPLLEALCKRYFRVRLAGAEHLPESGRALLVANRSGALPWDGLVLRTALRVARPELCPLRWLAEDSVIHYPFMGVMMNRLGAVRACPENAERLLAQDHLVAVFPEGAQGSRKLFRDRYRLQRFGRGGYVKLALKFGVPILPTAIIGAEETNPVLGRSRLLGRFVGTESMPITPTFPWLGPFGLLPAPVKWRIAIGEPIDLSKYGPSSADDALVVHRLNEQIRAALQALVDESKSARGRALFG